MTAALGGVTADAFLHMAPVERGKILESLIGREIRCVVGGDGADVGGDNGRDSADGGGWGGAGRVGLRVEGIANANPAAELAHLLSR